MIQTGARGEGGRARGGCSSDSGHRGAAARPLDGGALTRWGARTPARGPATTPFLHCFARSLARCVAVAERVREREEEGRMAARV